MAHKSLLVRSTILGTLACMLSSPSVMAEDKLDTKELLNLSLEQLSNIEVTSVSKRSEKASEAAAAIFVITPDDIRRSGATSIPEVLRIVPGLSVAQSGSHEWAITSRGTSNQFANKLLVLIDGRSVYTPLFSGVNWDVQDIMLQDIERIEVIRGPGATLWGANAVNGVINIITKSAKDTQGGLLSASAGNLDRSLNDVRYGAKVGDDTYARVYAKYDDRKEFENMTGRGVHDDWNKIQSGFRADGTRSNIAYTLQGDIYHSDQNYVYNLPNAASAPSFIDTINYREPSQGANLLGRLTYTQSPDSIWTLQTYFDNAQRKRAILSDDINTFDIDLQHSWIPHERHEIVWGLGYRLIESDIKGSAIAFFSPASSRTNLFNAFVQDKIALVPKDFFLTLGSKFEHNAYTGFEMQPSARLTWLINDKQTWWSSASHAVRTPNIFTSTGYILQDAASFGGAAYGTVIPNSNLTSENLNAYEMGYRIQPVKTVSLDVSTFYNVYGKLVTSSFGAPTLINVPGIGATAIVPVMPVNGNSGTTSGVEIAANWEVTPIWQLNASYTRLNFTLKNAEVTGFSVKGTSPKDQANLRSTLSLPHNFEIDNAIYYVDKLPGASIPSYYRFDARLSWKPLENLELSLVGQNLFDDEHPEFSPFLFQNSAQVPRAYYGNITWKF